jgi:hypothetical protein
VHVSDDSIMRDVMAETRDLRISVLHANVSQLCVSHVVVADTQCILFSLLPIDVLVVAHALSSTSFGSSNPSSYSLDLFPFVCKMLGAEKETNMCSLSGYGPMEVVDEEGIATAPYKIAYLHISGAWDARAGGIVDVQGTNKVESCAKEGASEGVAVMDGSINVSLGVNELFDLGLRPCNSFSKHISNLVVIIFIKSQIF